MSKEELMRFLEPFTDDIQIVIGHEGNFYYDVRDAKYGMAPNGEGLVVLRAGERAPIKLRTQSSEKE